MLVYFLWGAAFPFEFLGKLREAVNLQNKIELGSEDQMNVLLTCVALLHATGEAKQG